MNGIPSDIEWMLNEIGRPLEIIFNVSEYLGDDIFSGKVTKLFTYRNTDGKTPNGFRYDRRKDFSNTDKRRDWILCTIDFNIDNVFMSKQSYVPTVLTDDELIINGEVVLTLSGEYTLDEFIVELNTIQDIRAYNDGGELVMLYLSPFQGTIKDSFILSGSMATKLSIEGSYQNAEYSFIFDGREWDIERSDEGEYKCSYKIVTRQ